MTTPGKPSLVNYPLRNLLIDKQYYIHNADLHFRVEQTIFRVHSYFFTRESPQFRERMAGVECARGYDGRSDQTAIPVRGVSAAEFSHFLWIFYNPDYKYSAPACVWRNILTLASPARWDFPKVLALALSHLHDLDLPTLDRIALYKACSIPVEHLVPLYGELCVREEPLSLEESMRLGWEVAVAISQVREHLLQRGNGSYDDILGENGGIPQDQIHELIKLVLNVNEGQSSVMSLCGLHKSSALRQDTCDQIQLGQTKFKEGQMNAPKSPISDISDIYEAPPKPAVNGRPHSNTSPNTPAVDVKCSCSTAAVKQARNFAKCVVGGLKNKNRPGANA